MAISDNRTVEVEDSEWRQHAACRESDPDLFFPVGSTGPSLNDISAAKAVCRSCPVRAQCLDYALRTNQGVGVWGGTSEKERRRLRREWLARRTLVVQ
jgi:WhiB family redox-sensing transcriptional regulator